MGGWPEKPGEWNRYKRLLCALGFKSLLFNFYEKSEMKKSLIALAVLAASGASFAQVSITGNLTYGYQSSTAGDLKSATTGAVLVQGGDTAGLGAETTNVVFTAKEDLGGGYAATASMKLNNNVAGNATTGDDTSLTLATPVGGLVLGSAKGADYLSGGIAGLGAYYAGWDGSATKLFTTRTQRDYAAFIIPVGAFTFSVSQHEAAGSTVFGSGSTGTLAATNGGSSAPVTTLSATYTAGPLVANGQYAVYKNSQAFGNAKDTTRLAASYDLGMVKLGGGLVVTNQDNTGFATHSPKTTDYLVAAKVPMGASSFGLTFASRTLADQASGVVPASFTGTGYSLEYGYAMSKRTSVIANYGRWTPVAAMSAATSVDASSQYQLLLSHSF